jgi:hypothetical protein
MKCPRCGHETRGTREGDTEYCTTCGAVLGTATTSDGTKAPTNGWLGPDGVLHQCAEYGHIFVAQEIYGDNEPGVHMAYLDIECDMCAGGVDLPIIDSILTAALERCGYLKLATRRGVTEWYYWHLLKEITPAQADRLLAWCRDSGRPWPSWVDRETRKIL